ncbi:MAG: hypothetical protein PF549_01380 [Patescibacteria group bacterium]|jgi:hypothetical protein|nr:hypothetical protein [Patescibacteria group bacterium]
MNLNEIIAFLVSELGATSAQVKKSLSTTKALKGLTLENSIFTVTKDNAEDFMDQCAGKCPCRLFHIIVTQGEKKREVTTYNSKHLRHGYEKCSVTTSPKKERRFPEPYPE